ncbi:MAG: GC-type dockerin domain-anchored protein [Phycisphaerales bacterium]
MHISRTQSAIAAVSITTLIANAGLPTHSWLSPVSGSWNVSTNWDAGTVPTVSSDVRLGLSGAYTVNSTSNMFAGTLEITNPAAILHIENARTLDLFGNLYNDGLIIVNPTSNVSATQLDFEANATISGSGTIQLNNSFSRAQLRTGTGVSLTNGSSHSVVGWGQITASLINDGTIDANAAGNQLLLISLDKTNNALMRASGGGNLVVNNISLLQSPSAMVEASGVSSFVDFNSSTLVNGNLRATAGGIVRVSNATFDGVDFEQGTLHVLNAGTLDVFNSINNDGQIIVNPDSNISSSQLDFESSGSFTGSGEVVLNSFASRARLRTGAGVTMTNASTHTIRGWGQIEAALINDGLVSADAAGQELFLLSATKINNATMEAVNAGILDLAGMSVDQSGGGILIADGADTRIDLNSTPVIGGQINAVNGGRVEINSATYNGVSITGPHNLQNAHTLNVFNSIMNNGVITINPTSNISATQLDFENSGSFLGNGEVVLNSFSTRARLRTEIDQTMTNTATHTIRGYGAIEAALINYGLVSADNPGNELFFNSTNKVNNSTMQAVGTGVLDFTSISIDQTGGGQLIADGMGSRIDLNSATVIGGDLFSTNDAQVDVFTATLDGVNFAGDLFLYNAHTLLITNSITNNGSIVINPDNNISATQLRFTNNGAFIGSGSVELAGFSTRARIQTDGGVTALNGANHTIFGFGAIEANLTNNGVIRADVPANEIFLNSNDKTNNGTIRAVNEAGVDITSISIDQGPGGQVIANGTNTHIDLNNATIVDGQLNAINGGRVVVSTATLDGVDATGPIDILNAHTLGIRNGVVNNGTITVNADANISATQLTWLDDSELGGTGTVLLNQTGARARLLLGGSATMATLGQNQSLEGTGSIEAPLTHNGTTAPGMSIGTMTATQPITFTNTSVFEAEVDSTTADLLDSSSSIVIDGTLEVQFIDGFAPSGFWARKIIEGNGITGKFDAVVVPAPAAGFVTRVYNDGNNLFVGQTCPSDTNLDGALNFFDVSVFLSNYNAGSLAADLNGDGVLNFFDVSTFLSSYNMGC